MQKAEHMLQAVQKLGEKGLPLTRIYRCLYNEELFLKAYDNIGRKPGALTPGIDNDTADGMNLKRIRHLIDQLRHERYHFKPARRIQIPKKKGGQRPLGVQNFTDKLVQEALRMILEAYYEPRFRNSSHGFRPGRGCHTALKDIVHNFTGTVWFIEGDILGCFDAIGHDLLLSILARDIHDGRLLKLIQRSLKAGYLEQWPYHQSYSGTPQGSGLSPILANLYLNELDQFVEDSLIPQYTKGRQRGYHPPYRHINYRLEQARKKGDRQTIKQLEQRRRTIPVHNPQDPNYRRLRYCRYADDYILGFIGPKAEAEVIKQKIGTFLKQELGLTMSQDKTLITHAKTQQARFLNYAISIYHNNNKLPPKANRKIKKRSLNGGVRLGIPYGLVDEHCQPYLKEGKPIHRTELSIYSTAHIIYTYQQRFRGLVEYYKYTVDRARLSKLKYTMEVSLTKTLAHKYKTSVKKIYQQYKGHKTVDNYSYNTLQVEVPSQNGTSLIYWGAVPLNYVKPDFQTPLNDRKFKVTAKYSDLIERLQANQCQLCGSSNNCEVHHVRKLADLKKRWQGRKAKPEWVKTMIAIHRKTIVVCHRCHVNIHAGRPVPNLA